MKKNIAILGILLIALITLFTNCSKDEIDTNQKELLGKWISIDKSDTLEFSSENDFYKSNGHMVSDHYDYELFKDSIEIGYDGKLMILVRPTMHKYSIDNDNLTIDFSNKQCYGFALKEITYIKEKYNTGAHMLSYAMQYGLQLIRLSVLTKFFIDQSEHVSVNPARMTLSKRVRFL